MRAGLLTLLLLGVPPLARAESVRSADDAFSIELKDGWRVDPDPPGEAVFKASVPGVLPAQSLWATRLPGGTRPARELERLLEIRAAKARVQGALPSRVERYAVADALSGYMYTYVRRDSIGAEALVNLASATYRFEGRGITAGTFLDALDGLSLAAREPSAAAESAAEPAAAVAPSADLKMYEESPAVTIMPEGGMEARPRPPEETPRATLMRMVDENMREIGARFALPAWLTELPKRGAATGAWLYRLVSPGRHAPPPRRLSSLRRLAIVLSALFLVWPMLHLGAKRRRLTRVPWAAESWASVPIYKGPESSYPLAVPLEVKASGFGFDREYWIYREDKLMYRLVWPCTRSAMVWAAAGAAFLVAAAASPSFSSEPLGDLFLPGLAALAAAAATRLVFRNAGRWGLILGASGKALAKIEPSTMSTFSEEIYVALDAERKPLAYFPRHRFHRAYGKEWWICPTREEYGARIVETSIAKSLARRLFGHMFLFRTSFELLEGRRPIGLFKRWGLFERGRLEIYMDRSPMLPVIDPRAFVALVALLNFIDRDRIRPSFLG